MASPAAEDPPRKLPKQRSRAVDSIDSRDNATILLLLVIAIFIWVIFYYGKGGRLTWGQRKKLERQNVARALEFSADPRPPQVRNEAYSDAPAYSAYNGGDGGDSKYV
ncbi:hypothetical protein SLS63_010790 [Diaporthe eres]|uniref:Uncharacterized protein n=1 Tax=Diaporthe eres TaxID=83184 RepID=A0ABR1NVX2_DIAER